MWNVFSKTVVQRIDIGTENDFLSQYGWLTLSSFPFSTPGSIGQVRMLNVHSRAMASGSNKERVSLIVGIKDGTLQKYTAEVRGREGDEGIVCLSRNGAGGNCHAEKERELISFPLQVPTNSHLVEEKKKEAEREKDAKEADKERDAKNDKDKEAKDTDKEKDAKIDKEKEADSASAPDIPTDPPISSPSDPPHTLLVADALPSSSSSSLLASPSTDSLSASIPPTNEGSEKIQSGNFPSFEAAGVGRPASKSPSPSVRRSLIVISKERISSPLVDAVGEKEEGGELGEKEKEREKEKEKEREREREREKEREKEKDEDGSADLESMDLASCEFFHFIFIFFRFLNRLSFTLKNTHATHPPFPPLPIRQAMD